MSKLTFHTRGLTSSLCKVSQLLKIVTVLCVLRFTQWGERSACLEDALVYFPFSKSTDYLLRPNPPWSASQQNLSDSNQFVYSETKCRPWGTHRVIYLLGRSSDQLLESTFHSDKTLIPWTFSLPSSDLKLDPSVLTLLLHPGIFLGSGWSLELHSLVLPY